MKYKFPFDCAIVGGGLAGLSAAALLGRQGYRTVVIEKEAYPFHKVCGEYVSLESSNFLQELGLGLDQAELPRIRRLLLSSLGGKYLEQELSPGGVGISRYRIDERMARIARDSGVELLENTKVTAVHYCGQYFVIHTTAGNLIARVCCGAYGKHSNLDVRWKRPFLDDPATETFIGVKYHVQLDRPRDRIELHSFSKGYCGISPVEDGRFCLCYLSLSRSLGQHGRSIPALEEAMLFRNPLLKKIWKEARFPDEKPLTVSRISFERRSQVENHVLMLGDAAGMVAPLCGNGMSMAMQSGRIAQQLIPSFLEGDISREEMESRYRRSWRSEFSTRIRAGRLIQYLMLHEGMANFIVPALKPFPRLLDYIVQRTHGQVF